MDASKLGFWDWYFFILCSISALSIVSILLAMIFWMAGGIAFSGNSVGIAIAISLLGWIAIKIGESMTDREAV